MAFYEKDQQVLCRSHPQTAGEVYILETSKKSFMFWVTFGGLEVLIGVI
jgi:hypothetical protein